MNINDRVAIVTGATSGIGLAVATELAQRGAKTIALVDRSEQVEEVARSLDELAGRPVAEPFVGDTTDPQFRQHVFDLLAARHGVPTICVPAAGARRDQLAVKVDALTGCAVTYPVDDFRHLLEVNLIAPVYWGLEMIAQVAEQRKRRGLGCWKPEEGEQGMIVFIGSIASQSPEGQLAYASAKAGLDGVEATLAKEGLYHGVRCTIIHPDFTNTPMVRALGNDFVTKNVLPYLQVAKLSQPDEVADAVCYTISNSTLNGQAATAAAQPWLDASWSLPA